MDMSYYLVITTFRFRTRSTYDPMDREIASEFGRDRITSCYLDGVGSYRGEILIATDDIVNVN